MDVLSSMLVMSVGSIFNLEDKLDLVKQVPVEIAIMILRKLDGAALLNACRVSRYWRKICKTDRVLRNIVKNHLRELRLRRQEILIGPIGTRDFVPKNESRAFRRINQRNTANRADPIIIRTTIERNEIVDIFKPQLNGDLKNKRKREEPKKVNGVPKDKKRRLLRLCM